MPRPKIPENEKRVKLNCLVAPLTMERINGQVGSQGETVDVAMTMMVGQTEGRIDASFPPTIDPTNVAPPGTHAVAIEGGITIYVPDGYDFAGFTPPTLRPKKLSRKDQEAAHGDCGGAEGQ